MKTKMIFAAAALFAVSQTTAYAGDVSDAGTVDNDIIVLPTGPTTSASSGSLGSGGNIILPIVIGGIIFAATRSNSGS